MSNAPLKNKKIEKFFKKQTQKAKKKFVCVF